MDPISRENLGVWLPEKGVHRRWDVSQASVPPKRKPNLWQLLCLHTHSPLPLPCRGGGGILQAKISAGAFSSSHYYNFLQEVGGRGRGQAGDEGSLVRGMSETTAIKKDKQNRAARG